jgi:hypothetical protein
MNLTKRDVPFAWTDECRKAFDKLKERFLEEPILKMPDTTKQFVLETDASKWATGAVLKQIGEDGRNAPLWIHQSHFDTTRAQLSNL